MKKNQIGKSDLFVSELTLGCMSLGTDQKKALSIIDTALENGINHLDTADLYDFGINEEIVGAALQNRRSNIIVTSKVGNNFNSRKGDWFWDPSKKHIKDGLKMSLHRLHTDYIDLYMLHGGTIDDPADETIEAFEELKKEGLIRAYGISSIRPNVIKHYVKHANIDAVMMQYSLLDRRPEEELLNLLQENQISVLARGPLAKGMLSNHGKEQIKLKARDGYLNYTYPELTAIYDALAQMANQDLSVHTAALQYVLHHPAVASAVFGASSLDQLQENAAASETVLSDELYKKLQKATKPFHYMNHR